MKVVVLSDIHSNLTAFNLILDDIKKERPDKIIFLGDYITDGPNPNKVLKLVHTFGDDVILGNREEYMLNFDDSKRNYINYRPIAHTYDALSKENLDYIAKLVPEKLITVDGVKLLLIHGSGYFSQYALEEETYKSCDYLMNKYDFDICLFGHIHVSCDFEYKGKRFINPGSVGMPVDGSSYKYIILDVEGKNLNVKLREFSTKDTLSKVRQEMMKSDYYKNNKIWCEVNLKMIEMGEDFCDVFLKLVNKLIDGRNDLNPQELSDIWEKAYKELEGVKSIV